MLINFSGTNSFYQADAYFNSSGMITSTLVSASATKIVVSNSATGMVTTLLGSSLTADAFGLPTSGIINLAKFVQNGVEQASTANIEWPGVDFANAMRSIETSGDFSGVAALINLSDMITIDASAAAGGFNQKDAWRSYIELIDTPMEITGSPYVDEIRGGLNKDTITPGWNDNNYDEIEGSLGNDTIDLSGITPDTFVFLDYERLTGPVTFNVSATTNSGAISGTGFIDSVVDPLKAFQANGLGLHGSEQGDTFNLTLDQNGYAQVRGYEGADIYKVHLAGTFRLDFIEGAENAPTAGLVADLQTGIISNDGFGFTDKLNILSHNGVLEIRATDNNDSILGSLHDDLFILEQGNDTVDGAEGNDTIRYSRDGVGAVVVDLSKGTATGLWDNTAFNHKLINIENIQGSYESDLLIGDDQNNFLRSRGGEDEVHGKGGNDTARLENRDSMTNEAIFAGTFDGGEGIDDLQVSGGIVDYRIFEWLGSYAFVHTGLKQIDDEGPNVGRVIATAENIEKFEGQDLSTLNVETVFSIRATTANGAAPTDLSAIRDFDGNDLGQSNGWKYIGQTDVQFDFDAEFIYVNQALGRWATVGPDESGNVDFGTHGMGGETRVVGIYIDPEVEAGRTVKFSEFDSQQRFQNDLAIDNLTVIDAFDFDQDGFQEIYFKVNDGTAYLRALMHADGNIQYANYQSTEQVQSYLSGLGYGQDVLNTILV